MTTNSTWATLRKSAFRKLWGAAVISATCVLAHEDGRFRAFPQLGSLLSTVVALPFLLFTLSADTLTQSVDVSKLTWATDVYMAAAAFTSAMVGLIHLLSRQGRWSLGLHCDRYDLLQSLPVRGERPKVFSVRNLPAHRRRKPCCL